MNWLDRLLGRKDESPVDEQERKAVRQRLSVAKARHRRNLERSSRVLNDFYEAQTTIQGDTE